MTQQGIPVVHDGEDVKAKLNQPSDRVMRDVPIGKIIKIFLRLNGIGKYITIF